MQIDMNESSIKGTAILRWLKDNSYELTETMGRLGYSGPRGEFVSVDCDGWLYFSPENVDAEGQDADQYGDLNEIPDIAETDHQHTPGAMKAAEIILNRQETISTRYGKKSVFGIADLIEVKTALPELLEALLECMKDTFTAADGMSESGKLSFAGKRYIKAVAAIAKATGGVK